MTNIIKVPKPARTFKPDRPLEKNQLIQAQIWHFREAELGLPPDLQSGIDIASIATEGQASEYIRRVTRAIHQSGGRQARKSERAR